MGLGPVAAPWLDIVDPAPRHAAEDPERMPPGAASRYDWDGAIIMLFCRFNDRGIPATQVELIAEVQDWFAQNSPTGEIPQESTTRKKIAPIWRALRETA